MYLIRFEEYYTIQNIQYIISNGQFSAVLFMYFKEDINKKW